MLEAGSIDEFPVGFKLRYSLSGHKIGINQIAWSPNGRMLASSADDYTDFWNVETGVLYRKLNESYIYSVSWSPDGRFLASGGILCIRLWDSQTGKIYRRLIPPNPVPIFCIIWSPDGKMP